MPRYAGGTLGRAGSCVGYWQPSHHPACSVGGWSVLDATDGAWTRFAVGKGSSCDTVGRALCCCVLFPLYILCCVLFPKYMPTLNSHKCQRGSPDQKELHIEKC